MSNIWLQYDTVKYNGITRTLDTEDERDFNRMRRSYDVLKAIAKDVVLDNKQLSECEEYWTPLSLYCDIINYLKYERVFYRENVYPYYDEKFYFFMQKVVQEVIRLLKGERAVDEAERDMIANELLKLKGEK